VSNNKSSQGEQQGVAWLEGLREHSKYSTPEVQKELMAFTGVGQKVSRVRPKSACSEIIIKKMKMFDGVLSFSPWCFVCDQ
jgi:hypothetical protein